MATLKLGSTTAMTESSGKISLILTPSLAPSTPAEGELYYNSSTDTVMIYNGSLWRSIGNGTASGGTETSITGYKVHTFLTSGTFTVTGGFLTVEYLVIAGGGGGGGAGGGGAGGFRTGTVTVDSTQAVVVGDGGSTSSNTVGGHGSDSSFGLIVSRG